MNVVEKLQEIIRVQEEQTKMKLGALNQPIDSNAIQEIEALLEEKLPKEIIALYEYANGQNDSANGIFFGEQFCNSEEIIRHLNFSRTLIKYEENTIANPDQSDYLIKKIVAFYTKLAPKNSFFGLKKAWYKIEFQCGLNSFGGPYLYKSESTTAHNREIMRVDTNEIEECVNELYNLEQPTYRWDELRFVIFSDGNYELERFSYDFDNEIPFTSTPSQAIKQKYFHYKWLPIFSDYAGNYIGIDLDPDSKGKRGQVINFGRDEEDMFVLAENLEDLFDKVLNEFAKAENSVLNSESHLHEILKDLVSK